jgi:hypothetical protein
VSQARRDQDRDGLRNLAEFRAGDNPRKADTDDDGIPDGQEHAGRVTSFENGVLTISVFGGQTLTGMVTGDTEIECKRAGARAADHGGGDSPDNSGPGSGDSRGDDDHGDDHGRENDENEEHACPDGALAPGAVVHEAELRATGTGTVFRQIELVI